MYDSLRCPVTEPSQVGDARRRSAELAARCGLGETARGKLALVVTELGTNLLRHAKEGQLLFSPTPGAAEPSVQVLALDKGPGMPDLERCLQDGYSTTGTPGKGLGAVVRLADEFDILSSAEDGTAILARVHQQEPYREAPVAPPTLSLGVVSVPLAGEVVCGDGWAYSSREGCIVLTVVDGLGHGLLANTAAQEALRIFEANAERRPAAVLEMAHAGLRATRGAALAVVELDQEAREARFAGVGNISGSVLSGGRSQSMVSHNGIVGHHFRRAQEFTYAWPEGSLVILHSDGLATQWRLDRYPGLAFRDPALIAGVLYRDFSRGRDDVTVLVMREFAGNGPANSYRRLVSP